MEKSQREFLESLVTAPSPAGYEQPVRHVYQAYTQEFAESVGSDVHGNVIAIRNPSGNPRLMFAGHCDELGFQVNYVNDQGYIYFNTIGGHDAGLIPGRRVVVHNSKGPVAGVTGRRAVHLTPSSERGKPAKIENIWIDIAVADKEEAESLVSIGDPITYDTGLQNLRSGVVAGRALDNKIGTWVVAEALRRITKTDLQASVHAVATVQEEIGLRGAETSAYSINPDVAVAVDVTHATDHPNITKQTAGDVKLGGGATISRGPNFNPLVVEKLIEAAESIGISYQLEAAPRGTGTDANAIQLARAGVATGLVSVPLRYMHTPSEVVALSDADGAASLLAAFANRLTRNDEFTP